MSSEKGTKRTLRDTFCNAEWSKDDLTMVNGVSPK